METAYDKLCNRFPGHRRCLNFIRYGACLARVEKINNNLEVKCVSNQVRKGKVPISAVAMGRDVCCKGGTIFLLSRTEMLCCPMCCSDYCPNCGQGMREGSNCVCSSRGVGRDNNERIISL